MQWGGDLHCGAAGAFAIHPAPHIASPSSEHCHIPWWIALRHGRRCWHVDHVDMLLTWGGRWNCASDSDYLFNLFLFIFGFEGLACFSQKLGTCRYHPWGLRIMFLSLQLEVWTCFASSFDWFLQQSCWLFHVIFSLFSDICTFRVFHDASETCLVLGLASCGSKIACRWGFPPWIKHT